MRKTVQEDVEARFLEWHVTLDEDQKDLVRFDHFDRSLEMVFLRRVEGFDLSSLDRLKSSLRDVSGNLEVSSIYEMF
jgi:hypothetical protein